MFSGSLNSVPYISDFVNFIIEENVARLLRMFLGNPGKPGVSLFRSRNPIQEVFPQEHTILLRRRQETKKENMRNMRETNQIGS